MGHVPHLRSPKFFRALLGFFKNRWPGVGGENIDWLHFEVAFKIEAVGIESECTAYALHTTSFVRC